MIPLRLNMRNFMSYTDVHEPLCFEGIHVAVLSGDNGHGKSALLDAITWALWGRARARSVDELIHAGASEMEVEFEFLLDERQYRVLRKRQRRGKYGSSTLDFHVMSEAGYRSLTERSQSETERLIERTLRMSYDTFTSSSYIQQGRADSFTTSSPAERKRILAEILELGYYDELEGRAKERFKDSEARLADERRLAQDWEQEIARRPEYQAEVDRLRASLELLEQQAATIEGQARQVRERVIALEGIQQQLQEALGRIERLSAERSRLAASLQERRSLLQQAGIVIGRGAEIERAAAELEAVRRELETITEKQQQYLPLERAREPAVREELGHARKAAAQLAATERQHAELQSVVAQCREQAAEGRAVNTQLKNEMLALRERINELDRLSTCPTCQRPMDPRHKQRLNSEYAAQGSRLRDEFREHEATYRELEGRVTREAAQLALLAQALTAREKVQRRLAQAESALAQADEAQRQVGVLQRELAERQKLLSSNTFAPEARQRLAAAEERLRKVGYHEAAHTQLRGRAAVLAGVDRERALLEQARLATEHLEAQVGELQASLTHLDDECAAERQRHERLRADVALLPETRQKLAELDTQLVDARRARDEHRDQLVFAQSRLDNCAFLERKQKESLTRQDALRREQSIYSDLAYSFGRRGVQAMIIETAIPEIEEEANRILGRMTDGRMNVKFETQRDVRSGVGTIETLDIKIADELGTRGYEMFSGGEGFRVNFAIRIALSRLLAHRAGTRLQTLVVDEGFGSQDQEGRDRIVEAIQAIQSEFEKILVITHLEDLRDRFPVRIEVTKTPTGSTYAVCKTPGARGGSVFVAVLQPLFDV